jgi:serine/threonine-protein kinase HipA
MKHFDYNLVTSFSYEQLFQTLRKLKLPYPATEQMFRRMVFNVCARNCDDHTKNFSFRLKKMVHGNYHQPTIYAMPISQITNE